MIHKGQKYKALRAVKVNYDESDDLVVFTEGEYYDSPEDNFLSLDLKGKTVTVNITPDVADRCFEEERIDHPIHYNINKPVIIAEGKEIPIECIDVTRNMPFWKGNAIKYLWRAGHKSEMGKSDKAKEIEDLYKAIWYIQDRINQLKLE